MVSYISVQYLSFEFSVHARSYVVSRLLNNYLPHLNGLKYPGALIEKHFCNQRFFVFCIFYFARIHSYIHFMDNFLFALVHRTHVRVNPFYMISSIDHTLTLMIFDFLSSIEHTLKLTLFALLSSALIFFDLLLSVEQTFKFGIFCVLILELLIFCVLLFFVLTEPRILLIIHF